MGSGDEDFDNESDKEDYCPYVPQVYQRDVRDETRDSVVYKNFADMDEDTREEYERRASRTRPVYQY